MSLTWIAEEALVLVRPDGTRESTRIAVGLPHTISDREAACAVAFEPLFPKHYLIKGTSKLQALTLAVQFLATRLNDLIADGTRICRSDGAELVLRDTFGGWIPTR